MPPGIMAKDHGGVRPVGLNLYNIATQSLVQGPAASVPPGSLLELLQPAPPGSTSAVG